MRKLKERKSILRRRYRKDPNQTFRDEKYM
jgi:hypothetical protein